MKTAVLLMLAFASPLVASVDERVLNDGNLVLQNIPEFPENFSDNVQQYQNVRSTSFLDWAEAGEGIYVRTRIGDTPQIYRVPKPGGEPVPLTEFSDPVGEMKRQPGGSLIAFTMDTGGSEFSQIYILDPDTGVYRMLTDGASRNRLLLWNPAGTHIAYQTTRRNGKDNDVWIVPIDDPQQARSVYESDDGAWWGPGAFARGGRSLLLQQFVSVEESSIHEVDLETGETRIWAGGEDQPTANKVVGYTETEDGFYYISNARGRAAELVFQSIMPNSRKRYVTNDVPWDVTDFALSAHGRRAAFVTNEWGVSRLYLLDTSNNKYGVVSRLPIGIITNLAFNPRIRRLAITMSASQTPSDVFVINMGARAINFGLTERWTNSSSEGMDTEDFVRPGLIQYATFDMVGEEPRTIPAFLYEPPGDGPHPVVIHIHGGPETQFRPAFNREFQMWAKELGIAVIAPNIRGSLGYGTAYLNMDNGFKREDAVKDVGALLDWIATQPDLDQDRVAVIGASYGGYVALASAVHFSDRLSGAVNVAGISNFVTFLENTQDYRRDLRRAEYGDEREPEMRAFFEKISPLNNVEKISIPMLVVQGENDPRVPLSESNQMVEALRDRGVPVWYMMARDEGHGFQRKSNIDVYEQAVMMFFDQYLGR